MIFQVLVLINLFFYNPDFLYCHMIIIHISEATYYKFLSCLYHYVLYLWQNVGGGEGGTRDIFNFLYFFENGCVSEQTIYRALTSCLREPGATCDKSMGNQIILAATG